MNRNPKTGLKVKAGETEIFGVSHTKFDAELVNRFSIFLAAKRI